MANYCVPDKGKVALLTLSAQRDYVRPGSPVKGTGARTARPAIGKITRTFREQGAPIFHSIRLYRADGSNADTCRKQAIEEGLRIAMPGSLGAELIDEVKPDPERRLDAEGLLEGRFHALGPNEWVFYRPRWGAFHGTDLEARLRALEVTTLVICGFSFATGPCATAYEASARDFRIVVVPDAACGLTEQNLQDLGRIGVYFMTSDACLRWLRGSAGGTAAA